MVRPAIVISKPRRVILISAVLVMSRVLFAGVRSTFASAGEQSQGLRDGFERDQRPVVFGTPRSGALVGGSTGWVSRHPCPRPGAARATEVTTMTTDEMRDLATTGQSVDDIRARAVKQLKKRRDFYAHLLVYVLVNSFIVI